MILYHGTSWYAAKKIINDGMIRTTIKDNSPYKGAGPAFETTEGYVYLTCNEYKSRRYGNRAILCALELKNQGIEILDEDYLWNCIFEVDIDEGELKIDEDECGVKLRSPFPRDRITKCLTCDIASCLQKIYSVRCPRNLLLGTDVLKYKIYRIRDDYNEDTGECHPFVISDWQQLK